MKALKKAGIILAYILMAIVMFNQAIGLFALEFGDDITGYAPPPEIRDATWLVPLWLVTTLFIGVTLILAHAWKKKERFLPIPMVMGIVGAVLALVIALTFYGPYDMVLNRDGDLAQSDWDWFWRHLALVVVSLEPTVVSFLRLKSLRDKRIRLENNAYEEQFVPDLEDNPVAEVKAEAQSNKKLSKKQRKALREKQESGK